jgi:hypothetical protein
VWQTLHLGNLMNVDFYDNVKEPITCIHILFVGRLVGNDSLRNTERITKEKGPLHVKPVKPVD